MSFFCFPYCNCKVGNDIKNNLDYVKLDISKNKIDIDDETTFNDFISNSKWVSKTNEQQAETIIDTQPKGLESLSEVEAFRLKQFLK